MVERLAADNDVVLEHTDLTPDSGSSASSLGQTAEVSELAALDDLSEGRAISLSDDGELAAVLRGPTPRGGALAGAGAERGVRQEVVQVHVVAAEEEVALVAEGHRLAVAALGEVQLRVLGLGEALEAHLGVLVPLLELLGHDALVHDTTVVELGGADLILGDFLAGGDGREGSKGKGVLHGD